MTSMMEEEVVRTGRGAGEEQASKEPRWAFMSLMELVIGCRRAFMSCIIEILKVSGLEEYVYLQVVRFTIETLEVADEISVGYRIITYCQPSQKCVDQEVKAASQRHEDGSEPILAVVSSEYVTFKHIWYFYSLPLVIMSHGHPNTDYEDYWQNNELGALEAVLSLLARATWNLVVSVEISEQRNLDLKNVAQELVQRNGQEICIELNYQGCFCVGKYSQLAKEMINYRQVYFDLGL
ncbi:hypothetical protein EOD39_14086 [Acipenser ruthenus]|uniref:Uncharacterized protein n=1 Tax=Acipenser ruthenus TaxID=7906 RepID=A0A662YNV8_ACIRT|nr:hypothetical protein EOD39_14086 [Acipenser ruthenus]